MPDPDSKRQERKIRSSPQQASCRDPWSLACATDIRTPGNGCAGTGRARFPRQQGSQSWPPLPGNLHVHKHGEDHAAAPTIIQARTIMAGHGQQRQKAAASARQRLCVAWRTRRPACVGLSPSMPQRFRRLSAVTTCWTAPVWSTIISSPRSVSIICLKTRCLQCLPGRTLRQLTSDRGSTARTIYQPAAGKSFAARLFSRVSVVTLFLAPAWRAGRALEHCWSSGRLQWRRQCSRPQAPGQPCDFTGRLIARPTTCHDLMPRVFADSYDRPLSSSPRCRPPYLRHLISVPDSPASVRKPPTRN